MDIEIKCAYTDLMSIDKLIPNPKNPNKHPEKQIELLAKIIRQQGVRAPVVLSKRSGFIVKGHGRVEALKLIMGDSGANFDIPVDYQEYESEAMEYADMIADNKIAELAKTDMDMVHQEIKGMPEDFDLDLLGIPDLDEVHQTGPLEGFEEFSPELDEKNDYIVLLFDSKEIYKKALDKFGIETVKYNLSMNGNPNFEVKGVGRLIKGESVLDRL